MQSTETVERTDINYLRPSQVADTKSEIKSLQEKLENRHIQDKAEVRRQLARVQRTYETQLPKPPENSEEEGRLARREKQLLSEILEGMPSQEEMRKAPPGAVDKHRNWEARNKKKIIEWKNIRLRLSSGSGDNEVANLERYRPKASSLSMDNAYIPGKQFFMPPHGAGLPVTFTAEQLSFLRQMNPELADMIGTMSNEQRAEVKDVLSGGLGLAQPKHKPGRPKKVKPNAEGAQ